MFNNTRYVTNGIQGEINALVQMAIWNIIDSMEIEKDYLQIFQLVSVDMNGIRYQKIIHEQEQPPYRNEVIIPTSNSVNAKLYVIDDCDHSTMLLASEY